MSGIRAGQRVALFTGRRPRWWNVIGWIRWFRRPRGHYRVTEVTQTTMTIQR